MISSSLQERNQKVTKITPTMTSLCVLSRRNCLEGIPATRIEPVVLNCMSEKKSKACSPRGTKLHHHFPSPQGWGKRRPAAPCLLVASVNHSGSSFRRLLMFSKTVVNACRPRLATSSRRSSRAGFIRDSYETLFASWLPDMNPLFIQSTSQPAWLDRDLDCSHFEVLPRHVASSIIGNFPTTPGEHFPIHFSLSNMIRLLMQESVISSKHQILDNMTFWPQILYFEVFQTNDLFDVRCHIVYKI